MLTTTHKKRATTLSKALLSIGLLSGAAAGVITVTVAPAEALTSSLGQYQIDIEDGTPGTRGPYYGGKFVADLLTNDDPVGNPALISEFGATSYWLSNAPGSTKNFNVVLLPTGTLFGEFGPALPDGPTNNLYNKNFPTVDGKGFAFAYLENPGDLPALDDSYQIFSKPSSAPGGFSYYGCWGAKECVNAQVSAVPGPLPLLGLGAVLGYSRMLRKRIKTSKSPEL
jgi:hypothetical protein